jgi:predicted HicB family RNase H-like nuclease
MSEARPLKTEKLEVRVQPEQKKRVLDAAQREDITVGQFIRRAIVKALADVSQAA